MPGAAAGRCGGSAATCCTDSSAMLSARAARKLDLQCLIHPICLNIYCKCMWNVSKSAFWGIYLSLMVFLKKCNHSILEHFKIKFPLKIIIRCGFLLQDYHITVHMIDCPQLLGSLNFKIPARLSRFHIMVLDSTPSWLVCLVYIKDAPNMRILSLTLSGFNHKLLNFLGRQYNIVYYGVKKFLP